MHPIVYLWLPVMLRTITKMKGDVLEIDWFRGVLLCIVWRDLYRIQKFSI